MAPTFKKIFGWVNLPPDPLHKIACRLSTIVDFVRLRAVCKSWRDSMRPSDLSPQLPWLLLQCDPKSDARSFYCLLSKMIHVLYLHEAQGKWIIGSKHGWLILVEAESSIMTLLNPITRNIFVLPDSSFTGNQVRRTTISSPPTSPTGCTVMVLLNDTPFVICCSLFGNRWGQWVTINTNFPFDNFGAYDVIFHHKKFYVINDNLLLTIIDIATPVPIVRRVESMELPSKGDGWMVKRAYLMESEDDLLLNVFFSRPEYEEVHKDYFHQDIFHSRDFFDVFRLDESRLPMWVKVKNMHDHTMFLSKHAAMSMSTKRFLEIKRNSLYLASCQEIIKDDKSSEIRCIHVFNMDDGHVERQTCNWDYLSEVWAEPVWVVPSLT